MYLLCRLICFVFILVLVNGLSLTRRGIVPSSLSIFKGALLYKNGKQTTCELALTGITSGFIAASCFDFTSDGFINTKSIYQVRLDEGAPGQPVFTSTINSSDIHIHPNFDSLTLANNIAVVEFYKTIDAKYTSYIAVGGIHDGTQDLYVRRGYDELNNKWKIPEITTRSTDDAYCSQNSELFKANNDWMLCVSQGATSVMNSSCKVGYGVVYRLSGTKISLSAIYSHSVVQGTDTCGGDATRYDYYTRLEKYVGFAAEVLNHPIDIVSTTGVGAYSDHDVLSMSNPSFEEMSGTIVLSGDLYGRDPVVKAPEAPATTTPSKTSTLSKTSTAATPTEKTDNGSNTSSNNSSSSSSPMSSTKPTDNDDTITTFSSSASKTDESSNDDIRSSKGTQSSATSTYGSTETNADNDDSSVSDSISNTSDKDNSKTQSPMSESNSDDQDYGNITRDKVKIIGIAVPLSFVAICIVLAVLYKCWWVKKNDTGVNPYIMRMSQRRELLEILGTKDTAPSMNRLGSDRVLSWRESNAFSGNRHQGSFNY